MKVQVTIDIEPDETLGHALFREAKRTMDYGELVSACLESPDPWGALATALQAVNDKYNPNHLGSRVAFTFKRGKDPYYSIEILNE